eukprot:TRINITY_DN1424_c0_g1_i1.p1 TRINITY_DN1424_c0_g1~~TRINITY_DN1424_c0_g1_i1.p1  ORF type:complete len:215 (+),score=78.08 TRINITY_DN1424_c0_g1_i1:65-646(+)
MAVSPPSFSGINLAPRPWDEFFKVEKPSTFAVDVLVPRITKTFPLFTGNYLYVLGAVISLSALYENSLLLAFVPPVLAFFLLCVQFKDKPISFQGNVINLSSTQRYYVVAFSAFLGIYFTNTLGVLTSALVVTLLASVVHAALHVPMKKSAEIKSSFSAAIGSVVSKVGSVIDEHADVIDHLADRRKSGPHTD